MLTMENIKGNSICTENIVVLHWKHCILAASQDPAALIRSCDPGPESATRRNKCVGQVIKMDKQSSGCTRDRGITGGLKTGTSERER